MNAFSIHGHFYQPPRDDPQTEEIPVEPGAAPYHDWNERILAECYRPNAELGNFEHISFNIGPTLFRWMAKADPLTCSRIAEQERRNVARYGIGNALAQPYNHTILPLADRLDQITQIRWGIAEYQYRFDHRPYGMWLPETAANTETLAIMADCGMEYTILAPWQADRPNSENNAPAWVPLPGGGRMAVFFYQRELSTRISFDPGSTVNADEFFINRVLPSLNSLSANGGATDPLLLIASDGELYGHHQRFRDRFLAHLTQRAGRENNLMLTYPGWWLRIHPPEQTVQIHENTSWSCLHGVKRWSGECACTPNNTWKAPLRQAFDQLGEDLNRPYLAVVEPLGLDPWELRHQYIHVMLGEVTAPELVQTMAKRKLAEDDLRRVCLLLEAQRERQRMFTSCGWFFDDFDRIEPRNNVAYAAQAVSLTAQTTGVDLTQRALSLFKLVKSQRSELRADEVFSKHLALSRQTGMVKSG